MKKACKPIFTALLIIAIGASLSSVYLFSFFDGRRHTQEHIDLTAEAALGEREGSLPPVFLSTLFVPNLFGNITGENVRYLNPSHMVLFWEANLSGGIAISLLLFLAVILSFRGASADVVESKRQRRYILMFLLIYLFSLLCVLGRHTPFYRHIIGILPGIGQLPRPIRYRMLQCFATAILAAMGINSLVNLQVTKFKALRSWVWFYLAIVSCFIVMVLTYPLVTQKKYYAWSIKPSALMSGYFSAGQSVCTYSSNSPSSRIGAVFDGESKGEIRYANNANVSPDEGSLLIDYQVDGKGWHEFKVDIPPRMYVWFYQKTGLGRIGYLKTAEQTYTFYYSGNKGRWIGCPRFKSIWLCQEAPRIPLSLIGKLLINKGLRKSIVTSIMYWVLVSMIIIICMYYLSLKKFSYLLTAIALLEFIIFGMLGFYGGNFTEDVPTLAQVRAQRPLSHPMIQRVNRISALTGKDLTSRVATNQPFHDNFFRLDGRFALMGYEMHPLELRFKRAIEMAYGQPMNYSIYYNEPLPKAQYINFLSHFSVGYFTYFSRIDMFKKAIELNPTTTEIYIELGNLYREQSRHKEAEAMFKKAIELDPLNDEAYINFGRCYREQNRYKEAELMFKKTIELNPTKTEIYIELGNLYRDQSRHKEAEAMFKKAIELNPAKIEIYIELGNLYRDQSRDKEAEEMSKKIIELTPEEKTKGVNSNSFNLKEAQNIFAGGRVIPLTDESSSFVHTNPSALPRVFTLDRVVIASEEDQLKQLVSGDLKKAVYLGQAKEFMFKKSSSKDDLDFLDLQRANRILRFDLDNPNRINIDIEVKIPSMLVLTEIWYPGWKARIDGRLTEIYRVNYCQRGVWLEKGRHNVRFSFKPPAWQWGFIISLGTTVLLVIGLIITVIKKNRFIKKPAENF